MLHVELKLQSSACPLSAHTAAFPGLELRYVEMARLAGDSFLEVLEARGPHAMEFATAVEASARGAVGIIEATPERVLMQVVLDACCIRSELASRGWVPLRVLASEGCEKVTVAVRDQDEARALIDYAREHYPTFSLVRIAPRDATHESAPAPVAIESADGLTRRQEQILKQAIAHGYFEPSRGGSAEEIAREMGIHRSTFTRQLRMALRKVLVRYQD